MLGVVSYATVSALLAAVTVVSVIGIIGGTEMARALASARGSFDRPAVQVLADRGAWVAGIAGILSFVGSALLFLPLSSYLRISGGFTVISAAALAAVSITIPMLRGIFQGEERYKPWGASMVTEGVGRLVASVALVAKGLGTVGALVGMTIGSGAAIGVAVVAIVTTERWPTLGLPAARVRLHPGMAASVVLITIFQVYDLVLAKHYLSPLEAGLYTAASIGGRILFMLVSTIPVVLLPKTANAFGRGAGTKILFSRAVIATVVVAGACLALFAIAPVAMASIISGSGAKLAGPLLVRYGLASTFIAATYVITTYRIGIGSFDYVPVLAIVLVGEFAAMTIWHQSAIMMLNVLIVGHFFAMLASNVRLKHA
jgi:O-antigen/teichoic acid export membrane protein